jgi:chemotaxis protein MotB
MSSLQIRAASLLLVAALSSCVSSKKFKASEAARLTAEGQVRSLQSDTTTTGQKLRQLQSNYTRLNDEYNRLTGDNDKLTKNNQSLTSQLNARDTDLNRKNQTLQEQEKRLRELQGVISRQEAAVSNLRNRVASALVGFNKDELTVNIKDGKVYVSLSENLLFKSGSIQVDPKGVDALKKLSEVLSKNPDLDIVIEGHTDNVPISAGGRFRDNWDLSVLRATSIIRILNESGVNPRQTIASGRGEFFPVADNTTTEGKARNRRTEIIISPKLDELFKLLEGAQGGAGTAGN